jgi:hypothetical protein
VPGYPHNKNVTAVTQVPQKNKSPGLSSSVSSITASCVAPEVAVSGAAGAAAAGAAAADAADAEEPSGPQQVLGCLYSA